MKKFVPPALFTIIILMVSMAQAQTFGLGPKPKEASPGLLYGLSTSSPKPTLEVVGWVKPTPTTSPQEVKKPQVLPPEKPTPPVAVPLASPVAQPQTICVGGVCYPASQPIRTRTFQIFRRRR
jgi:hypothetical protein